jgi:hypothetical protein
MSSLALMPEGQVGCHSRAAMSGTVLMAALRIAGAWTLLSLITVGFWVLSLEFARRFASKPVPKPRGRERYN